MLTYQVVVEADNVARYVIQHNDLDGMTYAAPNVSVISQGFFNDYMLESGLEDIPSVLADLGVGNSLSAQDLQDMADTPIMATPPGSVADYYSSDANATTAADTSNQSTALTPIDTSLAGALADTPIPATPVTPPIRP